jgi:hypothetical protein
MSRIVPCLSEDQIERDAAALLAEYGQSRGVVIKPPVRIEDIVEKHLKIGIEFDDMHRRFGVPHGGPDLDILGAIYFDEGRIVIDEIWSGGMISSVISPPLRLRPEPRTGLATAEPFDGLTSPGRCGAPP